MKAMVIDRFGGPEVLEERDMPRPVAGPTQLLVRVVASAVNPVDYKIRQAGAWAGLEFPAILGWDVSGVVEEVGSAVSCFKPGDEVFYCANIFGQQGAYAEYHATEADIVVRKPKGLSHVEAASIPLAGGTAWEAVTARGKLQLGESCLIHAAAGGVGVYAVQMAKAAGAYVFGTCRAENAEFVRSLGADQVIDYRADDYVDVVLGETGGEGVDLVFDTVGGDTVSHSIGCTKRGGRLVTVLSSSGSLDAAAHKNLTLHFVFSPRYRAKMQALRTLAERGQLKPVVDTVMPLAQVAAAHQKLERGGVRGKIVLEV